MPNASCVAVGAAKSQNLLPKFRLSREFTYLNTSILRGAGKLVSKTMIWNADRDDIAAIRIRKKILAEDHNPHS